MRYETDMRGSRGRIGEGRADLLTVVTGMSTTLLLHGVLVTLVVVGTMCSDRDMKEKIEPKKIEFQEAELLALGEEKPDNQLPRIANPPTPTPDQETVALDQKKRDEPKKEKEKKKTQQETEQPPDEQPAEEPSEDLDKKMDQAFKNLHNPNRPTNDEVPEGSEKGLAGGTVSDEAMASLLNTYRAKLHKAIGERWRVPKTIPESELEKLAGQARVYVRISKSGNIVTYRFLNRTKNEQFNESIERLLRKFQVSGGGHSLPVPENPQTREVIFAEGLRLENWDAIRD